MTTTSATFADQLAEQEALRHGLSLTDVLETLSLDSRQPHRLTVREVDMAKIARDDVAKSRAHFDDVTFETPRQPDAAELQRVAERASYVEHGPR